MNLFHQDEEANEVIFINFDISKTLKDQHPATVQINYVKALYYALEKDKVIHDLVRPNDKKNFILHSKRKIIPKIVSPPINNSLTIPNPL